MHAFRNVWLKTRRTRPRVSPKFIFQILGATLRDVFTEYFLIRRLTTRAMHALTTGLWTTFALMISILWLRWNSSSHLKKNSR